MENFWEKINVKIKSYIYDDEIIHIIPTANPTGGKDNYYIVVFDDAHNLTTGNTKILNETQIYEFYKIDLNDDIIMYKRNEYPEIMDQLFEKMPENGQRVVVKYSYGKPNNNVWFVDDKFVNKYGFELYGVMSWGIYKNSIDTK